MSLDIELLLLNTTHILYYIIYRRRKYSRISSVRLVVHIPYYDIIITIITIIIILTIRV